jgi:hypothetical protein
MKSLMAESQQRLIAASVPDPGVMLEWGGGGSTRWFLDHFSPTQRLITVEHDPIWGRMLVGENTNAANWTPMMREATLPVGNNATPFEECPSGLTWYIHATGLKDIDTFLIDGVARGACLANVMLNGKPGASVFVHDAQRTDWYEWAWKLGRAADARIVGFDEGEYPSKLWMCRLK